MHSSVSYASGSRHWLWNVSLHFHFGKHLSDQPCYLYRTDRTCACTNASFQQASRSCIKSSCSPLEQAAAVVLQDKQCATGAYRRVFIRHPCVLMPLLVSSMSLTTQTAPATVASNVAVTVGFEGVNCGWVAVVVALCLVVGF